MKKPKLSVLFLTAAVALLLAACSDGMEKEEFATVTISLENSEASRQLVELGKKTGTTSEKHTYKLFVGNNNPIDMVLDSKGNLTASGVPTGQKKILEIRAYMDKNDFHLKFDELLHELFDDFDDFDDFVVTDIFTDSKILRAIGVSDPVTIKTGNNTISNPIKLYSAMEVSNWKELYFATTGDTDVERKEIVILKKNMVATATITIERPIEIRAEKKVTILRDTDFDNSFFKVGSDTGTSGKLAIGAILEGDSIGSSIVLDGGWNDVNDAIEAQAPLITAYADCIIGRDVTLRNNKNFDSPGGGVYVNGGTFTLYGTIENNAAFDKGGGVYVEGGTFIMENGAVIKGNKTDNYGTVDGFGGGVYIKSSSSASTNFFMNGGTIGGESAAANKASTGGGVFIQQEVGEEAVTFRMTGGYISYNQAQNTTGGGVNMTGGTFTMTGGRITNNEAGTFGGGVYVNGGTFDISAAELDYFKWVSGNTIEGNNPNTPNVLVSSGSNGIIKGAPGSESGW